MSEKKIDIYKLEDLDKLRSAPKLNKNISKILLNEASCIILKSDWITIGVMSPSFKKGINAVRKIDKKIIKNVIIFDVFEGKNLSDSKKSIAFKVIMQPQEKTFTDAEIENLSTNIIDLISKSFDGELRQ